MRAWLRPRSLSPLDPFNGHGPYVLTLGGRISPQTVITVRRYRNLGSESPNGRSQWHDLNHIGRFIKDFLAVTTTTGRLRPEGSPCG